MSASASMVSTGCLARKASPTARTMSPTSASYRSLGMPTPMVGAPGGPARLVMGSPPMASCRGANLGLSASVQTLDMGLRSPVVEVFGQPPVTYVSAPVTTALTRPGQSVEAVEVFRGPGGVQEIVEIIRDDSQIIQLRAGLEEKAILISEYQRRNISMQGHCDEYQRRLADAEGQMSQLRLQKGQLEDELRQRDLKIEEQNTEIENEVARNGELLAMINEQAGRIVALDKLVIDLEHQKDELAKKNEELTKRNQELEAKNKELEKKVHDLEEMVKQLQKGAPQKEEKAHQAPPPPSSDNLSEDDLIDHRIKEFFRNHDDFQVSVHKERAGLYFFGKPINKKVSMKVVGTQVLTRVGGGWEEVWTWLSQERHAFLEAEGIEEKIQKEGLRRSASFSKSHNQPRHSAHGAH